MCFDVFKPPKRIYVCVFATLMSREKTNKVVRNSVSLEQEFLICFGAAMLAMLIGATPSCPKTMNSSYK